MHGWLGLEAGLFVGLFVVTVVGVCSSHPVPWLGAGQELGCADVWGKGVWECGGLYWVRQHGDEVLLCCGRRDCGRDCGRGAGTLVWFLCCPPPPSPSRPFRWHRAVWTLHWNTLWPHWEQGGAGTCQCGRPWCAGAMEPGLYAVQQVSVSQYWWVSTSSIQLVHYNIPSPKSSEVNVSIVVYGVAKVYQIVPLN